MTHILLCRVRQHSVALVALTFFMFSIVLAYNAFAAAPVVSGTISSSKIIHEQKSLANRITQLEQRQSSNNALVEVIQRLDKLQREVQRIIGDVEVQTHDVKTMKKRQRELYLDIDRRLTKLEKIVTGNKKRLGAMRPSTPTMGSSTIPITSTTLSTKVDTSQSVPTAVSTFSASPKMEIDAYERAFNQLKLGRYDVAVASFHAFLETFPTAKYADNAQYWLGEANYVQRKYKVAVTEFQKVIDKYPQSPKLPDALLKMGYSHYELGEKDKAIKLLEKIVSDYPATTSARLAKKRLISIKSGG